MIIAVICAFLSCPLYSFEGKRTEKSLFFPDSAEMWSSLHIICYDGKNLIEEETIRTLWDIKWKKELVALRAWPQPGITMWKVVRNVNSQVPPQNQWIRHSGSGASSLCVSSHLVILKLTQVWEPQKAVFSKSTHYVREWGLSPPLPSSHCHLPQPFVIRINDRVYIHVTTPQFEKLYGTLSSLSMHVPKQLIYLSLFFI